MANIFFVIPKVFHKSPKNYLTNRVLSFYMAKAYRLSPTQHDLPKEKLDTHVNGLLETLDNSLKIPCAIAIDFSSPKHKDKTILEEHKNALVNDLNDFCPLIEGEELEQEEITWLNESWLDFSAGTTVIKRVTNYSESFYFFSHSQFDEDMQSFKESSVIEDEIGVAVGGVSSVEDAFGEAAKTLAEGMTGLLPPPLNVIGSTLVSTFWPTSSSATKSWEEIYLALQTIVRNELARQEVNRASKVLQGYINFLNTEYKALKDNKKTKKQELIDVLSDYDERFYTDIVNVFMAAEDEDPDFAAAALANFMTGACVHLNLNQERAIQDPKYKKPNKSAYATTMKNLIDDLYADYALETAPIVKTLRMEQISGVQHKRITDCNSAGCFHTDFYYFEDSNADFSSTHKQNQELVEQERQEYYARINKEMDELLQTEVYDVVDSWRSLAKTPVPNNVK